MTSRAQATSSSCLTLALSFKPRAGTIVKMVSKLGLRYPDNALQRLAMESPKSLVTWSIS